MCAPPCSYKCHPISLALAQRNGVEPQRKAAFYWAGRTHRTVCVPPASPSGPLRLHDVWAREGLLRLILQGGPSRLTIGNKEAAALWAAFYFKYRLTSSMRQGSTSPPQSLEAVKRFAFGFHSGRGWNPAPTATLWVKTATTRRGRRPRRPFVRTRTRPRYRAQAL